MEFSNKLNMYRALLVALLLVSALATSKPYHQHHDYFVSPPIPPTAFVGEYYTLQFRVLGLDNPVFQFEGLPAAFKGHSDGTIEGTPDEVGSFAIKVWFASKGVKQCKELTVRVSSSVSLIQKTSAEAVTAINDFIVVGPNRSLTYLVGDKIDLVLGTEHGKAPFKWDFLNLPNSLNAGADGIIHGTFQQEGLYSFSATVSDASGNSADSFFTINIQPKTLLSNSALVEVPNRNVPIRYDLKQVAEQQTASSNAVYAAIKVVAARKAEVAKKTEVLAKATMALQFATKQEQAAQANAAERLNNRKLAAVAENNAHQVLENAAKIVELTATNVKSAIAVTKKAVQDLKHAQDRLHDADHLLHKRNNEFINAQTQTAQAAQNAKAALSLNLNARNVYNLAFGELADKKKALQLAISHKAKADIVVANAKNALDVVNQANDDALAALSIAQRQYELAYSALDNANHLVSKIRAELAVADNKLGVAKFNLLQALNNLYVAQSRKEQADKSTSIVRMQTAALPEEESTHIFAGCVQNAYPAISGSAVISRANGSGYALNSGNVLVFGDCTHRELVVVGDLIDYQGYIKDGYVHAVSYKKGKHSSKQEKQSHH